MVFRMVFELAIIHFAGRIYYMAGDERLSR